MAAEEVLNFLDSYWFGHNILGQKVKLPTIPFVAKAEETKISDMMASSNLEIRSISARCLRYESSSPFKDYASPKSVITSEFSKDEIVKNEQNRQHGKRKMILNKSNQAKRSLAPLNEVDYMNTKGLTRSLSDLEYEEVKGFMDLGFVFSEEDKDSILVSIIPGLQRWGSKKNEEKIEKEKILDEFQGSISRPYLSEAWEVLEQRKANRQLRKWKLPSALVDESNVKNHLKAWAQTVASTVR